LYAVERLDHVAERSERTPDLTVAAFVHGDLVAPVVLLHNAEFTDPIFESDTMIRNHLLV
jgi:hypothetical protein